MKPNSIKSSSTASAEILARTILQRNIREKRLFDQAEGRIWLQCLPLISLVVFGLLWLIDFLRPVLIIILVAAPFVLIQIALWTSGRRIDALLSLIQRPSASTPETQASASQAAPSDGNKSEN